MQTSTLPARSIDQTPRSRTVAIAAFGLFSLALVSVAITALSIFSARMEAIDLLDALVRTITPGPSTSWEERSPGRNFRFNMQGSVTFTDAADDIARIEGRATIQETRDGLTRRIDFSRSGHDAVKSVYRVSGKKQPLDADGRRWVAEMIGHLVRESSVGLPQRVSRLAAKGGAEMVLAEIERSRSDHVRRLYIEELAKRGTMPEVSMNRFIQAVADIRGDFEQRSAWHAVLETQAISPAQQVGILNAVAKMHSAFEQRSVLEKILPVLDEDAAVNQAFRSVMGKMQSDFEIRSTLAGMANANSLDPRRTMLILDSTMAIKSDFERASVLKATVKHLAAGGNDAHAAYIRSAARLHSDYERRGVLVVLVENVALDRTGYSLALDATDPIASQHEKHIVLMAIAKTMPRDDSMMLRFREVAKRLGDHERQQVEKALVPASL